MQYILLVINNAANHRSMSKYKAINVFVILLTAVGILAAYLNMTIQVQCSINIRHTDHHL